MQLLLADDETDQFQFLKHALNELGEPSTPLEIVYSSGLQDLLTILERSRTPVAEDQGGLPDMVLLDITFAEHDGADDEDDEIDESPSANDDSGRDGNSGDQQEPSPIENGLAFLSHVRSADGLKHLPVIMYTTNNDETTIRDAYRRGANAYLIKPRTLEDAKACLNALVEFWWRQAVLPKSD